MSTAPTFELLPDEAPAPAETGRDLLDLSDIYGWGNLTPREQKFARGVVAGLSQRAAALAAGCTGENAVVDVLACRLAQKPSVRRVIAQALHRAGADLSDTITKLTRVQAKAYFDFENAISREERKAAWAELKEASALLIGIHARAELKISGTVKHASAHLHDQTEDVMTPAMLDAMALIRRAYIKERIARGEYTADSHAAA